MQKSTLLIAALAIMISAQLFFPLQMVFQNEESLDEGTVFKFKTIPIDPNEPFKGKYIRLNMVQIFDDVDTLQFTENTGMAFMELEEDSLGFAQIKAMHKNRPEHTSEYVQAKYRIRWNRSATITYPFNKFYMEESKAYPAELLYNQIRDRNSEIEWYVAVSIYEGESVINDVFVDDMPISEAIEYFDEEGLN
jgi:uncharacterized membrane-anchored protein